MTRGVLKQAYVYGGLKMINLVNYIKALKSIIYKVPYEYHEYNMFENQHPL